MSDATQESPPEAPSQGMTAEDRQTIIQGLFRTTMETMAYANGACEFQILSNLDTIRDKLKRTLSEAAFQEVDRDLEVFVKIPLRRQMGRIKSLARSIQEIQRYSS